ncbi:LLM class flavin-dependent oxidoreductase [Brucella intermedia GD04153]|uniref:LLM class flavin-dependent oxidoreductase n=1 Tax=Brucella intermedia GD04153 TaxID=2975438 RepID=A0AA42KR25_9HYPH|nr:LLM class flavin-dependent oxidoreductase [Brucella intermedia]MDH0127106.1 LLM class flavin-dependent oxidoreductase [Brucella intermedia GD04153]RRD21400.1 LLM class flavin-dependent oxidoreductase [Brucellaceae bacterium VT-16-1752]
MLDRTLKIQKDYIAETEGRSTKVVNPLYNRNKLKLGIFGANCDSGCAVTKVPERLKLTWESAKAIAQAADRAGIEVMVPVARWKGLGGETNFNGRNFETYTWAAAVAAVTNHIAVTTTSHVQTTHPLFAANQAATIDHIARGRYCMNVVCGWYQPELEMFGADFMEHDRRYDYAEEWIELVRRFWTETEEFSHTGDFFKIVNGIALPHPIQKPLPPIMNAGGSGRGQEFIASNADISYIVIGDHEDMAAVKAQVEKCRAKSAEKGREIQVWTHAYVVHRDTDQEARAYQHHYCTKEANHEAVDTMAHFFGVNTNILPPDVWDGMKVHLAGGYAGFSLVGSAETIARRIKCLSEAGIDGVSIHWVDYLQGLERFEREVMPLLEQEGLRERFNPRQL